MINSDYLYGLFFDTDIEKDNGNLDRKSVTAEFSLGSWNLIGQYGIIGPDDDDYWDYNRY